MWNYFYTFGGEKTGMLKYFYRFFLLRPRLLASNSSLYTICVCVGGIRGHTHSPPPGRGLMESHRSLPNRNFDLKCP